jgi:hypothetical protein
VAVNALKIRVGAPDVMTLFNVDLGSSIGGAELVYTPTNFLIEIDQVIQAVAVFKTKEEFIFSVALAQYQINLVTLSFGYAAAGVTTVTGTPNTDTSYFGGQVQLTKGTFDWTVPKNDGTTNHLLGHFNNVFSYKPGKLNYAREKHTEISKVELYALADLTQVAGQQAGWLREQY